MKLLVAVLAVDAMTTAVIFDLVEYGDMALGALHYGQRFWGLGIKIGAIFGRRCDSRLLGTGKEHRGFIISVLYLCSAFCSIDRHTGNGRGNEKNGEDIIKNFSFLFHNIFLCSISSRTQNILCDRRMGKKKSEQYLRSLFLKKLLLGHIMGNAVAITTNWEFLHHILGMWYAMAILALRNHLVLGLVAIGTRAFMVFGGVGHQQVISGLMAGCTQFGRCIVRIGNL